MNSMYLKEKIESREKEINNLKEQLRESRDIRKEKDL